MIRNKIDDLVKWKNSPKRKPLVIQGARQTGKTWLMKEFGRLYYNDTIYLNFEQSPHLAQIFENGYDTQRILLALSAETGKKAEKHTSLIIFDEIQQIPEALTSLKYFCEDAPDYHIVSAGSLLGMAMHAGLSFPVGKVNFITLHPMSYSEFLLAMGDVALVDILNSRDAIMIQTFKAKFIDRLKQYYYVGGMPEAVLNFAETNSFTTVRDVHNHILTAYELDFSKHAPEDIVPRIRLIWNSTLAQLSKENKKFIYGQLKSGARAKDYEIALAWLKDCGLIYTVSNLSKPSLPLKAYANREFFKLFIVDVGLLSTIGELEPSIFTGKSSVFTEFKGSLTEQFVLQQLAVLNSDTKDFYYWSADNARAEIDFVIQHKNKIYPIEVKAEENLKAKSLRVFKDKFEPEKSIRFSLSDFRDEDWLLNIPLYTIEQLYGYLGEDAV
jgi:predicted AAA+ superfamily ATPase